LTQRWLERLGWRFRFSNASQNSGSGPLKLSLARKIGFFSVPTSHKGNSSCEQWLHPLGLDWIIKQWNNICYNSYLK
jgi:hypothetical protein